MLKKHGFTTVIMIASLSLLSGCDIERCCNVLEPVDMPSKITLNGTVYGQKQLNFKTFSEFFSENGIPDKADYYLISGNDLIDSSNQPLPEGRYLVWEFLDQENEAKWPPRCNVDPHKLFHVYLNGSFSWFIISPYQLETSIEKYDSDYSWAEYDSMFAFFPNATVTENETPIEIVMEMEILNSYAE